MTKHDPDRKTYMLVTIWGWKLLPPGGAAELNPMRLQPIGSVAQIN